MTAKYKFNSNLLEASFSNNIEDAKKEWEFICDEKREEQYEQCICQRKVKHIKYIRKCYAPPDPNYNNIPNGISPHHYAK